MTSGGIARRLAGFDAKRANQPVAAEEDSLEPPAAFVPLFELPAGLGRQLAKHLKRIFGPRHRLGEAPLGEDRGNGQARLDRLGRLAQQAGAARSPPRPRSAQRWSPSAAWPARRPSSVRRGAGPGSPPAPAPAPPPAACGLPQLHPWRAAPDSGPAHGRAGGVSANASRTVIPSAVMRFSISAARPASPPNRWAQPVMSRISPSRRIQRDHRRVADRSRPPAVRAMRGRPDRHARRPPASGTRARASASAMPGSKPRRPRRLIDRRQPERALHLVGEGERNLRR